MDHILLLLLWSRRVLIVLIPYCSVVHRSMRHRGS